MERQLTLKKGITKRNGFNGALKPCKNVWNYKFITNKKFIQKIPVKLSQDVIDRILYSKKYPICWMGEDTPLPKIPDYNFGTLPKELDTENLNPLNIKYMLIKNKDKNGTTRLELLALYTRKTPQGMSIGLYYIPEGNPDKVCFIARICDHKGTNDHTNLLDGKKIDCDKLHMHIISEKFINACTKVCKNEEEFLLKLQSPDAVQLYDKCENITQMKAIAKREFNISDEIIYINNGIKRNFYSTVLKSTEKSDDGGREA